MNDKLSNWLKHPSYFFFWFFLGLIGLSYTFNHTDPNLTNTPIRQVSSDGSEYSDVLTQVSDQEFYQTLKQLENQNQTVENSNENTDGYEFTEEQIESYEQLTEGTLDLDASEVEKYLADKQSFSFENVSEADLVYLTSYEDVNVCGSDRNYIEKAIQKNAKFADLWIKERQPESKKLPRKCISFVMNSFPELSTQKEAESYKKRKSATFASCPGGSKGPPLMVGGGRSKNAVPCVSKNLVNMTYNAYVDVMTCLKIDPKDLLPKIYNESGFFINALGAGMDGGIGQLTQSAIEQVNSIYPKYIEEIAKAAAEKPDGACARIMQNKALIMPVKKESSSRCSLLWPVENPLRNILYAGILTRYNMRYVAGLALDGGEEVIIDGANKIPVKGDSSDQLTGKMKEYDIKNKLASLGMRNVNLHKFQKMITLAGYNSGVGSAMNVFNNYLDQRIAANNRSKSHKYDLKPSDFDFVATKDAVKEARSYITSSFIRGSADADKLKKRKALPAVWASAYTKTFPEYIVLKLNSYNGDASGNYKIYGFPGYLSALALKNQSIRETFKSGGVDPEYCSSEQFLNFAK